MRFSKRKLVASTLILSFVFCLTSCGGFKKEVERYSTAFDELDFKEVEYSDFKKLKDDSSDLKNGVYVSSSSSEEIKKITKQIDSELDSDDLSGVFLAKKSNTNQKEDGVNIFEFGSLSFNQSDDAKEYFDKYCKLLDEQVKEYKELEDVNTITNDSDDNYYTCTIDTDVFGNKRSISYSIYINENIVISLVSISYYDDIDEYNKMIDTVSDKLDLNTKRDR